MFWVQNLSCYETQEQKSSFFLHSAIFYYICIHLKCENYQNKPHFSFDI